MTWDSQYSAAREAPYMLLPGQSMPAEGETDNPGTGTTPHTTASATSNPSPDTSSHSSSSSSSSLSAGAIAGIVLGAVSFVAILCLMLFILGRNNVYKKWVSSSEDGCGNVNAPLRTARWALSNSVEAGAGSRCGKSECEGGVGELGLTPALGPSSATRTGFGSMDHHPGVPRSAIISTHESGDGQALETGHPSLARASQVLNQSPGPTHAGQKGQPYWIWDQSIQPHPYLPKKGPSELDGEPSR
ncbi:hypothetical protein BJX63DRAFT_395030 [Aspergillus granulosus]|uniref:Uncharacterized protein n=1 Tax=Aspergillus granulosus TaxID=176169 RepID=A0ABR4HCL2_9EURO